MKIIINHVIAVTLICIGCTVNTTHQAINKETQSQFEIMESFDGVLYSGELDSILQGKIYDENGDGIFDRKIVERNITSIRSIMVESGVISTKVCINQAGVVMYSELINSESTITNIIQLKGYLSASRGYKFQPDTLAPNEQCGKLKFTISNEVNYRR